LASVGEAPPVAPSAPSRLRRVSDPLQLAGTPLVGLSEPFEPFLTHFAQETLRCGEEVWLAESEGRTKGLFLCHGGERVASVFTRERAIADAFFRLRDHIGVYSDFSLSPNAEVFHVYETPVVTADVRPGFTHPVRAAREDDRPALVRLMTELYGTFDARWLDPVDRSGEKCFVVEVGGVLVGAAWVSVVPGNARLHSLSVRPGFRRMGVGTDLWSARVQWARLAGAARVVTEISEHNVASRAIATAGGMRPVGELFLSLRT
jgi:GNAT superfamily N-acetyltransferase